jgi:hypothetical protein
MKYRNVLIIKNAEKIKKENFLDFYLKVKNKPPKYFKSNKIEFYSYSPLSKEDIVCEARFFRKEGKFLLVRKKPVDFDIKSELYDENTLTVF